MEDDFEAMCERNREKNKAVLAAMGLDGPMLPPLKKSVPKPRAQRKRRAPSSEGATESDETEPPQKAARVEGGADSKPGLESAGLRRSGRNAGRKVDYTAENIKGSVPRLASVTAGLKEMDTELRSVTKRVHDPKTFGAIPGIVVGTWWLTREECSIDAIHAPWVAGIAGGPHGAYSVALSGGYEDDLDYGEAFTYTGAGGRDLKGTKSAPKNLRTAPQSCDQSFDNPLNKALKRSCETKKPVRVIRGFKLKSPYAPAEGYRYDGLYTVEKAWMEKGLNPNGWKVCKFAFKRVPGQAPLVLTQTASADDEATENSGSEA